MFIFFFKQKTAYEMRISDWSSDVCSSDLHIVLPLDLRRFGGSALTADIDVPKDGVPEVEGGTDVPITYVPARNLIFLSPTLGLAEARAAQDIVIGVNALDYSGYPDCRPEFIQGFEKLAALATPDGEKGVDCHTPPPPHKITKPH